MSTPPFETLPTSACFASIVITMTRAIGSTQSPFTFERQSFKWPGESWSAEINMPPIKGRAVASDWISFGLNLEGSYGQFLLGDPTAKLPRGVATGTPLVTVGGQTGNTLNTKGWTPNINGIMLKGDYIQLGTGGASKLYMVTRDSNSDGSGNAQLYLQPSLRTSPAADSAVITQNPVGLFRLVDNNFSWGVSPGQVYRISFRAEEVVSA